MLRATQKTQKTKLLNVSFPHQVLPLKSNRSKGWGGVGGWGRQ